MKKMRPVMFDGIIYVMMAITGVNMAMLSSDNAAKYISYEVLFYMMWVNGILDAALLAIKLYRSTAFADHKQKVKEETAFFVKKPTDVTIK